MVWTQQDEVIGASPHPLPRLVFQGLPDNPSKLKRVSSFQRPHWSTNFYIFEMNSPTSDVEKRPEDASNGSEARADLDEEWTEQEEKQALRQLDLSLMSL